MPIFDIETPGGKVVQIEAPDEAQALAGAQQWHAEQNPAPAATPMEQPPVIGFGQTDWDLGSEILNGMTFGTLPNIQGAVVGAAKSLPFVGNDKSLGENYDTEVTKAQTDRRNYREAHPLWATAGDITGGVITGGGLIKGGITAANGLNALSKVAPSGGRVAQVLTEAASSNLAPSMARGAAEGAAFGAAAGFGGAEGGLGNRMDAAGDNLAFGAALGAGAPAVARAVTPLARFVGDTAKSFWGDATKHADELLVRRIMQDKTTPGALADSVGAAKAAGQGEFMAVDAAGKNTQRLASMAVKTPGPLREEAGRTLAARQQGQGNRLADNVDELTGQKGGSAFATQEKLIADRRAASGPLYDEAYKGPTPTDPFYTAENLGRQSVQDAMRGAERTAAEKQVPLTELFTEIPNPNAQTVTRQTASSVLGPNGQPVMQTVEEVIDPTLRVPTVRGWDFIKRELDAKVNQLYKAGDTTQAEAVKETRNALRDRLGKDNPKYGEALAQYSDDKALEEALGTGGNLAKASGMALDESEAAFKAMSPEQQALARLGFAKEKSSKLTSATDNRDKTLGFRSPDERRKADIVASSPEARAAFQEKLGREEAMVRTNRELTGGSNTFENMADGNDLSSGSVLAALASQNYGRAAALALGRAADIGTRLRSGLNEESAARVGEILLSNDPNKLQTLADMFAAAQAKAAAPRNGTTVFNAGVNAPRQRSSDNEDGMVDGRLRITVRPDRKQ